MELDYDTKNRIKYYIDTYYKGHKFAKESALRCLDLNSHLANIHLLGILNLILATTTLDYKARDYIEQDISTLNNLVYVDKNMTKETGISFTKKLEPTYDMRKAA
jgi:hypothetical protein